MILGYFVYMEGTVRNQIIKGNTNNIMSKTSNTSNLDNLSIKSIIVYLLTYLSYIHPISFITFVLVFIYSLCLIYGLFSLNRGILTPL
jgi:hypothetical protein